VKRVLDIRLNNTSQLAAFARRDDLAYFLRTIGGIAYEHDLRLAPTPELLEEYRKTKDWPRYEREFRALMRRRKIAAALDRASFERTTALLCSEHEPEHCHRRIVSDLLAKAWGATVIHL
jgi:uncharacterized protein (DUF488 family)